MKPVEFVLPLKTTNPNNGQTGNSKLAAIIRGRKRAEQRAIAGMATRGRGPFTFPVTVTVTRIAPSRGLDPHDGLGAALKGAIDGIADGLGLKDDRDPRVRWVLDQRRSVRAVWGVEVRIEARAA